MAIGAFFTGGESLNRLLRNDQEKYTDVTLGANLTDVAPTDNAIWMDYNRDGFIDLLVGNLNSNIAGNKRRSGGHVLS